jgi:zinc-ribbon domain
MNREATCLRCKHVLRVSPDVQAKWLTCPRCLASVGNPNVLLPAEPPPSPVTTEPAPRESSPEELSCPRCGRPVGPDWRVCPACETPLRRSQSLGPVAPVDDEVRRDSNGAAVVGGILAGFLALGLILFFAMGGMQIVSNVPDALPVLVLGVVALVVVAVGVVVLVGSSRSRTVTVAGGLMGGLVVGGGIVLLIVLLFCMAIVNVLTCGKGCR